MRVRSVPLNAALLGIVFRPASAPNIVITSDWPDDAEIIASNWDFSKRQVRLMVASATFDDVPPGNHPVEWSPTFTARDVSGSLLALFERMDEEGRNGT